MGYDYKLGKLGGMAISGIGLGINWDGMAVAASAAEFPVWDAAMFAAGYLGMLNKLHGGIDGK